MNFWSQVLPGWILRIQHEHLETQVRRILNYCELPFELQCIDFHKTERTLRTPSSEQVRQPIYKSDMDQWRQFEEYLQPLVEALEPSLEHY